MQTINASINQCSSCNTGSDILDKTTWMHRLLSSMFVYSIIQFSLVPAQLLQPEKIGHYHICKHFLLSLKGPPLITDLFFQHTGILLAELKDLYRLLSVISVCTWHNNPVFMFQFNLSQSDWNGSINIYTKENKPIQAKWSLFVLHST